MNKIELAIGIKELEEALKFAKENKKEVIVLEYEKNPIGGIFRVSKDFKEEKKDIPDYDIW